MSGNRAVSVVDGASIVVHNLAGASVVRIIGDVDLAVAGPLRATLESALATHPWVIVDLRRADAVDSVGLGVLLAARQAATRASGDLVLAAASPFFHSVMRAARVGTALPAFDTVPQAMTYVWRSRAGG